MGFVILIPAKMNGLWWGPTIRAFLMIDGFDCLIDLAIIHDLFILLSDMHAIISYLCTNLSLDSAWWLVAQVRTYFHSGNCPSIFSDSHMCMINSGIH